MSGRSLRLLMTGGSGVLGRALAPIAWAARHRVSMPTHAELDLFDPAAVAESVSGVDAIIHLASRIQPLERLDDTAAGQMPVADAAERVQGRNSPRTGSKPPRTPVPAHAPGF
jgi:dTDP-4-dehydrorhamnose reductase